MHDSLQQHPAASFTPAAGVSWLTPLYDLGIVLLTRERRWRSALMNQMRPAAGDVIADVGCGTGSLLVRLGKREPGAHLIGVDPDEAILARARTKAAKAGVALELHRGFAGEIDSILAGRGVTKVVSSLVLHQVPMEEKVKAFRAMRALLHAGGEVHIADYGYQRSRLMRMLFRCVVQRLDGRENTEPNARGILPELMRAAGIAEVTERAAIPTATGSISLYRGVCPRC